MKKCKLILFNGTELEKGDYIQLSDIIGEKYKQTRNYDINIENPINLYEHDNFDFKHVEILPTEKTDIGKIASPIAAHKLLSKFQDSIQYFMFNSGNQIAYTNYFKIDINNAIINNEIQIVRENDKLIEQDHEIDLIETIQEVYELYSIGLFSYSEFRNQLDYRVDYYYQVQTKWEIKFRRSISGKYFKIE